MKACRHQGPLRGDRVLSWLERRALSFPGPQPKVGIVVVGWDEERTQRTIKAIEAWIGTESVDVHSATLVLNRHADVALPRRWSVLGGSNSAGEFSGYDEGISWAEKATAPDIWLLANDRYGSYDAPNLAAAMRPVLQIVWEQPVVVGHVDQLNLAPHRERRPIDRYVRTNFVLVSHQSLARARPCAIYRWDQVDQIFPAGWPFSDSLMSAPLDAAYLSNIAGWLTGLGRTNGRAWYRATQDPAAAGALRTKAVSILNEHLLSQRLALEGVVAVDTRRVMRMASLLRRPGRLGSDMSTWPISDVAFESRRGRVISLVKGYLGILS